MGRWITLAAVLTLLMVIAACDSGGAAPAGARPEPRSSAPPAAEPQGDIGGPLLARAQAPAEPPPVAARRGIADPIVLHDGRIVAEHRDVPSQRDGVILVIGTPARDDEEVPPDRLVVVKLGKEERRYRELRETDLIQKGQVIAQIDNRLALAEAEMKGLKIPAVQAEKEAAIKTRDEALLRWKARIKANDAPEEIRGAALTYERYISEVISKEKGVDVAKAEKYQADVMVEMHEVRAPITGKIGTIFKKSGEAIKSLETVFQVKSTERLRVEGMLEVQHLPRLRRGMKAVVEPVREEGILQVFQGHLQEVNGVAVSRDGLVASASEDKTVRVWDRKQRRERHVLKHPAAVRAVACTPPGHDANLCLSGAADGKGRLWDLSTGQAARELKGQHRGAITCAAFSPDGKSCVTGGEDRELYLWDTASGDLRYRFPTGHRGAVTSLQFTPHSQLVSAARDNSLILWQLGEKGAQQAAVSFDRRSGNVTTLGVSPDGKQVLFDLDQGKALRVLSLEGGLTEGVLQNSAGASGFSTFAIYSPDGRLILTAGSIDGRLQLWRAPVGGARPSEVRQLVCPERAAASCACFAPDGSFLATGSKDHKVLVWPVPGKTELETQLSARVTMIEPEIQSSRTVRIWVELENPGDKLLLGNTATIVLEPE